jgi:hypothetical protein
MEAGQGPNWGCSAIRKKKLPSTSHGELCRHGVDHYQNMWEATSVRHSADEKDYRYSI